MEKRVAYRFNLALVA